MADKVNENLNADLDEIATKHDQIAGKDLAIRVPQTSRNNPVRDSLLTENTNSERGIAS